MKNNENFYGPFYNFCYLFVRPFWRKHTISNEENMVQGGVYVSHHQNMYGPFSVLIFFPKSLHTWVLDRFFTVKGAYRQYIDYTLTERYGIVKPVAALIAAPVALIMRGICKTTQAIPVFREGSVKVIETLKHSAEMLVKNENVLIFVDRDYQSDSAHMGEIYPGFLNIERYYNRETGKHAPFIPIYSSKKKRTIMIGKPEYFRDGEDYKNERQRIATHVTDELNRMAKLCGDL